MRTNRRPVLLCAALGAAIACGDATGPSMVDLMMNRAKWDARGPDSYTFEYRRSFCECSPEMLQPVRITVAQGQVVAVVNVVTGDTVPPPAFRFTIDGLFDDVAQTIAGKPYRMWVTYDLQLGYPTEAIADLDEQMVDDDWGFSVRHLAR